MPDNLPCDRSLKSNPSRIEWTGARRLFRPLLSQRAWLDSAAAACDRFTLGAFQILRRALPLAVLTAACVFASMAYLRTPWVDEIWFLDTGVELAKGHGFQNHTMPQFLDVAPFALNYPLFMLLMAALIRLGDLNFLVIRGSCFLLTLGACLVFIEALRRVGFWASRTVLLFSLLLLLLSDGVLNAGTHARPECITMLVYSLLFWALLPQCTPPRAPSWPRLGTIVLLAALVPWCALHLLLPVGVGLVITWLLYGYDLKNVAAVLGGLILGVASVLFFYYWTRSLETYRLGADLVGGLSLLGRLKERLVQLAMGEVDWIFWYPHLPRPVLFGWLLAGLGLLAPPPLGMAGQLRKHALAAFLFSIGTFIGFAFFANAMAWYAAYYYPPICMVIGVWTHQLFRSRHPACALAVGTLCLGLASAYALYIAKLPRQWWPEMYSGHPPHMQVAAFMRERIAPDDVAVSNESAYYAVRPLARDWYPLRSVLTLDDRRAASVTKLVLMEGVAKVEATYFPESSGIVHHRRLHIPLLLDVLARRWNCSFHEMADSSVPRGHAGAYRVFEVRSLAPPLSGPPRPAPPPTQSSRGLDKESPNDPVSSRRTNGH